MKKLLLLFSLIFICSSIDAQGILKRLGDRTMDKIQRKAEDKLVDELSEKLANEAVKPIDSFMDSLFAASYEQETGEKYDPNNRAKMSEALNSFLGTAEIPDSYEFEYWVEIELKDFGSKKSEKMVMLVSKSQPIFGIEQNNDGKEMRIIFDNANEAMVSYDLEKDELIAIPLNANMMTAFSSMSDYNEEYDLNLKFEKLNKSKTILGYKCEGMRVTSDESKSDAYVSDEVPFSWDDSFGTMLKQFAPHFYQENEEYQIDGMLMEAKTTRLDDDKKSEWKTKKIEEKATTINNGDYKRTSFE